MRDIEGEAALVKAHQRVGEWLMAVDRGAGVRGLTGGVVTKWSIRQATEEDPMVLLVVKAYDEHGIWIAFVGAPSCTAALLAWRAREKAGGLKWRPEKSWEDRQKGVS